MVNAHQGIGCREVSALGAQMPSDAAHRIKCPSAGYAARDGASLAAVGRGKQGLGCLSQFEAAGPRLDPTNALWVLAVRKLQRPPRM